MTRLDIPSRSRGTAQGRTHAGRMPMRHKVMLLLAFEILVAGVTQAGLKPSRTGILVEVPAHPGHVVT